MVARPFFWAGWLPFRWLIKLSETQWLVAGYPLGAGLFPRLPFGGFPPRPPPPEDDNVQDDPKVQILSRFCAAENFFAFSLLSLTKETWGDAWGEGVVGAVQQVWHRDGDHQDWKVRKCETHPIGFNLVVSFCNESQRLNIRAKSLEVMLVEKAVTSFFKYDSLSGQSAMPQNYWCLGWWCTIRSIHCTFEARGSIISRSDTCKKFIGGRQGWSKSLADTFQRGRRLQPSEYEWAGDRLPPKFIPAPAIILK